MANTLAGIDQGMVDDESRNAAPNAPSALPVLKWGAANGGAAPSSTAPSVATATPDINPLPSGTMLGARLRRGLSDIGNSITNSDNDLAATIAKQENTMSSPVRQLGGYLRDAWNGAVGNPLSPDAGQPLAPQAVPQLNRGAANINWYDGSANSPAPGVPTLTKPSLAGVTGAVQTSATPTARVAPAASPGSLVDAGVTLPGGRRLNYGAMVNGVPTFSDGSSGIPGRAGSVPRTMTDADIQNLGARLSTYDHNAGPLASDVLGYTPSTDQRVATLTRNMQDAGTGFTPSASDYARANAADIASGDWRSAAGTVAHNLAVDAQSGSSANRKAALQRLSQYTGAMNQADTLDQDAAAKSAQLGQQGQQALQQENLRGQYGLQEAMMPGKLAQLYRERHPLTLADGTIATMDPITGDVRPATLANGQAAKAFQPKDDAATKRTDQVTDDLNKAALEYGKNFMPTKDKPAPTTADYTAWRTQAAKTMGLPTATNPKTGQSIVSINGQWVAL